MSHQSYRHEGTTNGLNGEDGLIAQARLRQGLTTVASALLILMLAYLILQALADILRPLLIAVFLCYLIVPAHHWLVRHRVPSLLAYLLITGLVLGASYGLADMTFRSIGDMSKDLPTYVQRLQSATDQATIGIKNKLTGLLRDYQLVAPHIGSATTSTAPAMPGSATPDIAAHASPARSSVPQYHLVSTDQLISFGRSGVQAFVGLFTSMFVVAVFMLFLLAEVAGFERRIVSAFGAERAGNILEVTGKINAAVAQYIAVKTFTSLLLGAGTSGILYFFGVDYALLWGILAFFANFIPYIGSMVAVALPILISYAQTGSLVVPLELLILLTVCQMAIGYIIEPKMIGKRLGVSPLTILLSLAFWGLMWGVPGMVLSAPLIVTLKIVLENIEQTRPIAKMMSND